MAHSEKHDGLQKILEENPNQTAQIMQRELMKQQQSHPSFATVRR